MKRFLRSILTTSTLIVPLALAGAAPALASSCQGLNQATCDTSAECRWVSGYTRASGTVVGGYCRVQSSAGATKTAVEEGEG